MKKRRASFTCKLRASTASVVEEQKKCIRETPRNTDQKSSVEYDYESENEEEQEDDAVDKYELAKKAECGEGGKTPVANSISLCRRNNGNGWKDEKSEL